MVDLDKAAEAEALWRHDLATGKFDAIPERLDALEASAEDAIARDEPAVLVRARTLLHLTTEIRRRRERSAAKPAESEEVAELRAEVARLKALINTPQTDHFFDAVRVESAHQVERWGTEHDAGKKPSDWFWLLGYLSGKALTAAIRGDNDKALHHVISSAASLFNWYRALRGVSTLMRPGIEPPQELTP